MHMQHVGGILEQRGTQVYSKEVSTEDVKGTDYLQLSGSKFFLVSNLYCQNDFVLSYSWGKENSAQFFSTDSKDRRWHHGLP